MLLGFHLFTCICFGLCQRACLAPDVCVCVCLWRGLPFHPCIWVCISVCISVSLQMARVKWVSALSGIILCQHLSLVGSRTAQVPGLQWYVAIQDPAVMQMNRILCTGWGSRSSRAGLATGSHWPPLKRVCCRGWLPGTSAGMRRWWRRWEGSEGELVVGAALHVWREEKKNTK